MEARIFIQCIGWDISNSLEAEQQTQLVERNIRTYQGIKRQKPNERYEQVAA